MKVKIEDIKIQLINQKEINQCILLFVCIIPQNKYKHHSDC